MNQLLDGIRVLVSIIFLAYASWSDLKTREVSNKVWILYAPIALFLTTLQYVLLAKDLLYNYILSVVIIVPLSLILFYAGGFGGADAKALICLSIALPHYPIYLLASQSSLILPIGYFQPVFALSIFINAVLLASLSVLYVLLRNFSWKYGNDKSLFKGLEKESLGRKILVVLSGHKVTISELEKKSYFIPLEDFDSESGRRNLIAIPRDEDREKIVSRLVEAKQNGKIGNEVWVTPGLPMLVFITAGLFIALVYGDILWTILHLIL